MPTTRREFLIFAAASLAAPAAAEAQLDPNLAASRKAAFQEALRRVVGDAQVRRGRVKLQLPPLIDNGNSVPLSVAVEDDPLLKVAIELEKIALKDEYFIEKKLYPNIDFYSGITLKALGFPTSMFTVLFALARTVGWIAQWREMLEDPHQKIGRPRQIYTGPTERRYTAIAARK